MENSRLLRALLKQIVDGALSLISQCVFPTRKKERAFGDFRLLLLLLLLLVVVVVVSV